MGPHTFYLPTCDTARWPFCLAPRSVARNMEPHHQREFWEVERNSKASGQRSFQPIRQWPEDSSAEVNTSLNSVLSCYTELILYILESTCFHFVLTRLAQTYNLDIMETLLPEKPKCGLCGQHAAKRCSKCQGEWYCNRYDLRDLIEVHTAWVTVRHPLPFALPLSLLLGSTRIRCICYPSSLHLKLRQSGVAVSHLLILFILLLCYSGNVRWSTGPNTRKCVSSWLRPRERSRRTCRWLTERQTAQAPLCVNTADVIVCFMCWHWRDDIKGPWICTFLLSNRIIQKGDK